MKEIKSKSNLPLITNVADGYKNLNEKGKEIFKIKDKNISANDFKNQNPQIFSGDLNKNLYAIFYKSKQLDAIREYSDTTKRIFKATGLVSFENGYAELAFKDICNCIFDIDDLKRNFIGKICEKI